MIRNFGQPISTMMLPVHGVQGDFENLCAGVQGDWRKSCHLCSKKGGRISPTADLQFEAGLKTVPVCAQAG